jgi:hypothetical protein
LNNFTVDKSRRGLDTADFSSPSCIKRGDSDSRSSSQNHRQNKKARAAPPSPTTPRRKLDKHRVMVRLDLPQPPSPNSTTRRHRGRGRKKPKGQEALESAARRGHEPLIYLLSRLILLWLLIPDLADPGTSRPFALTIAVAGKAAAGINHGHWLAGNAQLKGAAAWLLDNEKRPAQRPYINIS